MSPRECFRQKFLFASIRVIRGLHIRAIRCLQQDSSPQHAQDRHPCRRFILIYLRVEVVPKLAKIEISASAEMLQFWNC